MPPDVGNYVWGIGPAGWGHPAYSGGALGSPVGGTRPSAEGRNEKGRDGSLTRLSDFL